LEESFIFNVIISPLERDDEDELVGYLDLQLGRAAVDGDGVKSALGVVFAPRPSRAVIAGNSQSSRLQFGNVLRSG